MKMVVEHLAAELTRRYVHYPETLLVDLSIDEDTAEFRIGFSLPSDHRLHQAMLQAQIEEAACCHSGTDRPGGV